MSNSVTGMKAKQIWKEKIFDSDNDKHHNTKKALLFSYK